MMHQLDQAFIGNTWSQVSGHGFALVDPATEQSAGHLVCAGRDIVDRAIEAAQASGWGRSSAPQRLQALERLAAQMQAAAKEFAQTISQEIGTPIDFARSGQVEAALGHLQATIDALRSVQTDVPLTNDPAHRVRYDPIGVAALITPWNWPLNQVVLKLAAALAAGCPVVLKPSELSTRTALVLMQAVARADLPQGVVNMVPGDGTTGQALVEHPGVDVISFTGSTAVGRQIAARAAERFARSTLELGGKSPNILFDDCDLPLAIRQGVAHCFRNAGQSCNAASRMLVHRSIYDRAVTLAAQAAQATEVGLPQDPGGHIGPLVSADQFDRVQRLIAQGLQQGGRCVAGGAGRMPGFNTGYFAQPTVFADVDPQMNIFREEIFGPVLTMTPFDDEAHAIALANDTGYGLAGYIQTSDAKRADRVARALRVGMVQVNGTSRESGAPFGGVSLSGWGREAGLWGIRAFQEIKSISGAALPS